MDTERTPAERAGDGFITAEQQRRYVDDPDQAQLDRYFHLDTAARERQGEIFSAAGAARCCNVRCCC
jgi:hypothetical protein